MVITRNFQYAVILGACQFSNFKQIVLLAKQIKHFMRKSITMFICQLHAILEIQKLIKRSSQCMLAMRMRLMRSVDDLSYMYMQLFFFIIMKHIFFMITSPSAST